MHGRALVGTISLVLFIFGMLLFVLPDKLLPSSASILSSIHIFLSCLFFLVYLFFGGFSVF